MANKRLISLLFFFTSASVYYISVSSAFVCTSNQFYRRHLSSAPATGAREELDRSQSEIPPSLTPNSTGEFGFYQPTTTTTTTTTDSSSEGAGSSGRGSDKHRPHTFLSTVKRNPQSSKHVHQDAPNHLYLLSAQAGSTPWILQKNNKMMQNSFHNNNKRDHPKAATTVVVTTADPSLDALTATTPPQAVIGDDAASTSSLFDDTDFQYVSYDDIRSLEAAVQKMTKKEEDEEEDSASTTTITTPAANVAASDDDELSTGKKKKRLTIDTMSQSIVDMQYAVRGQVVIAADKISEELSNGSPKSQNQGNGEMTTGSNTNTKNYPFEKIVYTNIGNPHSVGQHPLTWPRQVLALVDLPDEMGVDHPDVQRMFPADAIERAKEIKIGLGGVGTGAYSHSMGAKCFRDDVAKFIQSRDDGVPSNPDSIFLTNGASQGISHILKALVSGPNSGVMIPIPQYPIYSATIDVLGGKKVGYHLEEDKGWGLDIENLERTLNEAKESGIDVNSFVLINPGNPTGNVLSRENVHDVVEFCAKHKLVLLADEVYQENIYKDDAEFVSCKRAAYETGLLEDDAIELISFHSVSKGVFGECGRRGGYMELVGIDPEVQAQIYKLASSELCSTITGQIMTSLMVRGPNPDGESYQSHQEEKNNILQSLKHRSKIVSEGLDSIAGFQCNPSEGSMYCFPSITLPPGAIREAANRKISPDTLYAISLLEHTGICVVPASGFGQKDGRFGFRTTFLPPEEEMAKAVELIRDHYESFCNQYAD